MRLAWAAADRCEHSTRCFTASKPIAPRSQGVADRTLDLRAGRSPLDGAPGRTRACLPCVIRASRSRRRDEGSGRSQPANGAAWIEGADLLSIKWQVMQRVEDQVLAVVGPAMPGDHLGPAADHHLIDVAPDEQISRRPRARNSRCCGNAPATANSPVHGRCIAGIIGSRRQWQENLTIPLETLADGLLVAPQPRRLAPAALFGESIVEGRDALGTRDGEGSSAG